MSPIVTEGRVYEIINNVLEIRLSPMVADIREIKADVKSVVGDVNAGKGGLAAGNWLVGTLIATVIALIALLTFLYVDKHSKNALIVTRNHIVVAQSTQDAFIEGR